MKVLILNSGSSSIKFQVLQMPEAIVLVKGLLERIGESPELKLEIGLVKKNLFPNKSIDGHKAGLEWIAALLKREGNIEADDISIVGHRVVHGGSFYDEATIVTESVKTKIAELSSLATLHNPSNLLGIVMAEKTFTKAVQVAVFDTAFFQNLPAYAYTYAIPKSISQENKIRKYGFHGTSHSYVYKKAKELFPIQSSKVITIHLGNGCSISAIKDGICVEHSLGFTPLPGLVMGTRSGDVDPSVITFLMAKLGYSAERLNVLLTKESGLLGLTGKSDMRDILASANKGDADCQLAIDLFTYRIKQYIGSYAATMNGVDVIVFTAGIGENAPQIREMSCNELDFLGIEIDLETNNLNSSEARSISSDQSKVKVLVIPTNEELEIAQQAFELVA